MFSDMSVKEQGIVSQIIKDDGIQKSLRFIYATAIDISIGDVYAIQYLRGALGLRGCHPFMMMDAIHSIVGDIVR